MKKIAVDMGSFETKIYMAGCGVVLIESTCLAVEQLTEGGEKRLNIKAYGDKARALSGRAAVNTHIINPVKDGDIAHVSLASCLLQYFLGKIEITPRRARRTQVLFILPCGYSEELRAKYMQIADECGFCSVCFTITPFAAVLGHNISLSDSRPVFCIDIGYGITDIAALSRDGIIAGINVNLGGGNIDVHIMDELAENRDFKIGTLTAERIKNTVGSLLPDDNKMTVADGRELTSGSPASLAVNSSQILTIIKTYIDKILEYVSMIMAKLPAEVSSAIMHGGVYLSGGLLKMDGLAEYIGQQLRIGVNLPEEPRLAAVIGGGAMLSDEELLNAVAVTAE